jgi:hypothetical protein
MKHLNPEGARFQVIVAFRKSLFHDVPEQLWVAFAGSESAVAHNLFELRNFLELNPSLECNHARGTIASQPNA